MASDIEFDGRRQKSSVLRRSGSDRIADYQRATERTTNLRRSGSDRISNVRRAGPQRISDLKNFWGNDSLGGGNLGNHYGSQPMLYNAEDPDGKQAAEKEEQSGSLKVPFRRKDVLRHSHGSKRSKQSPLVAQAPAQAQTEKVAKDKEKTDGKERAEGRRVVSEGGKNAGVRKGVFMKEQPLWKVMFNERYVLA